MDATRASLARPAGTQEVLNDLLAQRGLTKWCVVLDAHSSTDSDEVVDIIYGSALTASLQEERIDRKRKQKEGKAASGQEQPTWSCFLVLPAVSAAPTLSMKRILALQQCAEANEPSGLIASPKRTFLCLTDGANIRCGFNCSRIPVQDQVSTNFCLRRGAQLLYRPRSSNPAMTVAASSFIQVQLKLILKERA